ITVNSSFGLSGSLRYRYMGDRAANETNTVIAKGYTVMDMVLNYTIANFTVNLSCQNLLDTKWNEAQFDTESRLKDEPVPVSEIHFTPGTPRFIKVGVSLSF
ncbi:MAG TPA: TonB-dependent receptor, partial [Chryseolinea sp.]|nr:TonB-dependent receptor [Chryseolinea sp.]